MSLAESPIPIPVLLLAAMNAPIVVVQALLRIRTDNSLAGLRVEALGTTMNVSAFGGAAVVYAWGTIVGLPVFAHGPNPPLDPIKIGIWAGILAVQWAGFAAWIWRSIPTERWIYAVGSGVVLFWCIVSLPFGVHPN